MKLDQCIAWILRVPGHTIKRCFLATPAWLGSSPQYYSLANWRYKRCKDVHLTTIYPPHPLFSKKIRNIFSGPQKKRCFHLHHPSLQGISCPFQTPKIPRCTSGCPLVMVPVLSSTAHFKAQAFSQTPASWETTEETTEQSREKKGTRPDTFHEILVIS